MIAFARIPLSTAQGPEYHLELEQRIRGAASSSVPVTTDLSACLGAFREIGARRVTVISNYQEGVLPRLEASLAYAGVDIAGSKGIGLTLAKQIASATFDTAYDLTMEAFRDRPDTDALFLSSPPVAAHPEYRADQGGDGPPGGDPAAGDRVVGRRPRPRRAGGGRRTSLTADGTT